MASIGNFRFGNRVLQDNNHGGNVSERPARPSGCITRNVVLSSANVHLLEEFVGFCEAKNKNLHDPAQQGNGEVKALADSSPFRNDIKYYFGDQLPDNVVYDLCKLVDDNTHGKCSSCRMPTESLVFSVLQILSDAARINNTQKENMEPPTGVAVAGVGNDPPVHRSQQLTRLSGVGSPTVNKCRRIRINDDAGTSKNVNSSLSGIHGNSFVNGQETHCIQQQNTHSGEASQHHTNFPSSSNLEPIAAQNSGHSPVPVLFSPHPQNSKEASDFLNGLKTNKQILVLNTPLVMCHGNLNSPITNKESKVEALANHMSNVGEKMLDNSVSVEEAFAEPAMQGDKPLRSAFSMSSDRPNLTEAKYGIRTGSVQRFPINDEVSVKEAFVEPAMQGDKPLRFAFSMSSDRPNLAEARHGIRTGSVQRFPITDEEFRYYNVICGLAHSQWRGLKAVEFSTLTTVKYCSLGESLEPGGIVDSFFVSGICRYFFETVHPRQSKKHFFYPKVGGSLYTYNSLDDTRTVEKSFLGANSAYRLHLSHKLCFPVIIKKHWFVFLVDLRNKMFVFLDSYYDWNSTFQKEARLKLINSFKECWHQYAEGYTSFDDFRVFYPPVPKQTNVVDCGVFAVKFMELWDNEIDLRDLFDHSDIANIRVKLAVDIFFSPANTVNKSTVIHFFQQGINPRVCA